MELYPSEKKDQKLEGISAREAIRKLLSLQGSQILNEIFDHDNPHHLIRNISRSDFIWLIKKIGEDDFFPILRMASLYQWQHLVDVEIWRKDRFDIDQTTICLGWLLRADPERLVNWLFSDGQFLSYLYFSRNIQLKTIEEEEDFDLPEDFFSPDNVHYIRIIDKKHEQIIRDLIKIMAHQDYARYQALLLGLAGVQQDEVEEEMFRLRNVRLAEDGFLPFQEAISVYSFLKIESLEKREPHDNNHILYGQDDRIIAPVTSISYARGKNMLSESTAGITDSLLLDRIGIEFAGLCNQILSADGLRFNDLDDLIKICHKATGYISLGLEKVSGGNILLAKQFLKHNPLISIFQAGFGLSLELKWEAEKWIKDAWFLKQNFDTDYWGDKWGGILSGLLKKIPRFFAGFKEGEEYKNFESLPEIEDCRIILSRLMILDRLFEVLTFRYGFEKRMIGDKYLTFHQILINFWARKQLGLDPGFHALSIEQVRDLFSLLRPGVSRPPYNMPGAGTAFIKYITSYAGDFNSSDTLLLKETLLILWQKFFEEYTWIATADLDGRYSKFVSIKQSV